MDNSEHRKNFFSNPHALGTAGASNDPENSSIRSDFVDSTSATNFVNLILSPDVFANSTSRLSASDLNSEKGLRDIIASTASTAGPSSILAGQVNDILTHRRLDNASAPVMQMDAESNSSLHPPGHTSFVLSPLVPDINSFTTTIQSTEGLGRSHVDFHNVNKLISGPVAPELEHTTRRLSASGSVDASISLASNTSNPVAAQENKINSLPWINEKRGSHRPQKSAPISTDVISSTSSGFPTSVRASSLYSSDTELYVGHSDTDGADDHIFFTSQLMDDPTLPSSIDFFTTSLVGPPRQRPRHGSPSDLVNTTTPSTGSHSTIPPSTPLNTETFVLGRGQILK